MKGAPKLGQPERERQMRMSQNEPRFNSTVEQIHLLGGFPETFEIQPTTPRAIGAPIFYDLFSSIFAVGIRVLNARHE